MSLHAQILAAEVARSGAPIDFEDPALAPFAADLAGANGFSPNGKWGLSGLGHGLCRIVRPVRAAGPAVLVVGDVPVSEAVFWLHPPSQAHLPGWTPIHPSMPEFVTRSREEMDLPHRLRKLLEVLQNDQRNVTDWISSHLEGKSRLLTHGRPAADCISLELDPLSVLAPMSRSDALRHAARGAVRLDRDVPLSLRLPTLSVQRTVVQLTVWAAGAVEFETADHARIERRITTSEGVRRLEFSSKQAVPWLDITLLGNSGRLDHVALSVPSRIVAVQETEDDTLGIYSDPLDAYASPDYVA